MQINNRYYAFISRKLVTETLKYELANVAKYSIRSHK